MKTLSLQQGSAEWHEHRRTHWNASDAPAMLGISPYKTRAELLREYATGIAPEINEATQRRFDAGHRYEALARPLAEEIIGEELYPCVGVAGRLSASFDGITLLEETIWEHKTLSESLRGCMRDQGNGADLPEHFRAQLEQQLMVSGAERALFMATVWDRDFLTESRHCWYASEADLRARIVAGWAQFEVDLAAYKAPPPATAAPVAAPVSGFGVLALRVEGSVLASNLDAFRAGADAFLARLPKPSELQTDQDFVDADAAVKACADAEDDIKAAKKQAIAQMADVDAVLRMADAVADSIRSARLALDKAVTSEKERRRAELVQAGIDAVWAHYIELNTTLGEHALRCSQSTQREIGESIKGLKTLASMRDKIDAAVANAKIAASQQAEKVRANVAVLAEVDHPMLFADRVVLCATKAPDDLRRLAQARVAEHLEREERRAKLQAEEAARIEQARVQAEIDAQKDAERRAEVDRAEGGIKGPGFFCEPCTPAPQAEPPPYEARTPGFASTPPSQGPRIRLGEINALIAPLSISAEGLAQLGFNPVATDKAAKLYDASRFDAIKAALVGVISRAALRAAA